jgi:phospholipid/cholesterol/gamma-HCH transport system substrate-binding protein
MDYRSSEVKAGFFIFTALVTLTIMVFMLGNIKDRFTSKRSMPIVFNFTGGLEEGAPVRYAGLDIGRVAHIQLLDSSDPKDMDRVTVTTEINPSITIKKNSTATIKTSGLMGGLYIDIRPGTNNSPVLQEGETLMGQDSFEFAQIGDMVEEVVLQVRRFIDLTDDLTAESRTTLKSFQASLNNINSLIKESRGEFQKNLKNMSQLTASLANLLENNEAVIGETLVRVHSITQTTDQLLQDNSTQLEEIIEHTHRLTREMEILMADTRPGVTNLVRSLETDTKEVSANINSATAEISANIDSATATFEQTMEQGSVIMVENRRNLMEIIHNLNETTKNLKIVSEDIKLNPWKLVRKSDEQFPETKTLQTRSSEGVRMKRLDKVSAK